MIQIKLTPDQFAARLKEVSAQLDQPLQAESDVISHSGVRLSYSYDGATLTIQIISKPFFLSEGEVESKISAWFAGS